MDHTHIRPRHLWTIAVLMLFATACNNEPKKSTVAAVTPYHWNQSLFCLNMLSNISAHWQGYSYIHDSTTWAVKAVLADTTVRKYIGTWTCVWGPVVVTGKTDTPANTMFIAQQGNNYVVAIAGTDPSSKIAAVLEDADVATLSRWDQIPKVSIYTLAAISKGTRNGLDTLLSMKDPAHNNLTAYAFLKSQVPAQTSNTINIWVTGHSLGGFLSPTYALYLHDSLSNWPNSGKNVAINCLAVAGATPGNASFADYYKKQLGSTTIRVWNTLDVVPHAYQSTMLAQVDSLYYKAGNHLDTLPVVIDGDSTKKILSGLETLCAGLGYTQLNPSTVIGFTSDMYTATSPLNANNYFGQMLYQHIPAYAVFFGVDSFQTNVQRIVPNMKTPFFSEGAPTVSISNYDTTSKNFNK